MTSLSARTGGAIRRAQSWRESAVPRDVALLCARVGLAWIFIYHGAGTLFGAFHGPGIRDTAAFFASTAHLHPGTFFACCNGITEFFGGIAIGLGAASRLAGLGLFVDMVVAMCTVTWHNGIVSIAAGSGYEINIALAVLALAVVLLGAGRLSVDSLVGRLLKGASAPA